MAKRIDGDGNEDATGAPNAPDAAIGRVPELAMVPLALLSVDAAYQRSMDPRSSKLLVRRIARAWDWRLCKTIAVARRPDGSMKVTDGQHRIEGAALRGAMQDRAGVPRDVVAVPCAIWEMADAAEEAATFVELNARRRSLTAVDIHRARLVAGDADANAVGALIAEAGLALAPHSNWTVWKPGMLFCVPGIAAARKRHGADVVAAALADVAEAFSGQVLRYAGQMIAALVVVEATEGARPGFDRRALVARLGANTQAQWMRRAAERVASSDDGIRAALVHAIVDAYRRSVR